MRCEDSELTLLQYWKKHMYEIADSKGWDCKAEDCCKQKGKCQHNCHSHKKRKEYCATLRSYGKYIEKLDKNLKKPISRLSFEDVKYAISQIRGDHGRDYQEATIATVQSALNVVFAFAAIRGDAYNIMKWLYVRETAKGDAKKNILRKLHSCKNKVAQKNAIQKELQKYHHKTKSLTIQQLEKLTAILWEKIVEDGRICLIVLMLYTGIRPAEGRALFWRDIEPYVDHGDEHMLDIFKIRDAKGEIKMIPKSDNGFRRVPIHRELECFLQKRRAVVERLNGGKPIDDLPICCFDNEISRPCKDYEVALAADEVFEQIIIKQEEMYIYALEYELEKLENDEAGFDKDQQLTLYVLRRNFWTWMMALTMLSDMEKRCIMGHEMVVDKKSIRKEYNNENLLYTMLEKMNGAIISRDLHKEQITYRLSGDQAVYMKYTGIGRLVIPEELRKKGGKVIIEVISQEIGDTIRMTVGSNCPPIQPKAEVEQWPMNPENPRINCEYEEWEAHKRARVRSTSAEKPREYTPIGQKG